MRGFIRGGMRGFIRGAWVVLFRGACMVLFRGERVWQGGMCGRGGVRGFIWGGVRGRVGHVTRMPPH